MENMDIEDGRLWTEKRLSLLIIHDTLMCNTAVGFKVLITFLLVRGTRHI